MSTKSKRHIHKYYRVEVNGEKLWACGLPNCYHHMPRHYEGLLPGKFSICWKCGEVTTLDDRTLHMDKPLCEECDPNYAPVDDNMVQMLKELGAINKVTGE